MLEKRYITIKHLWKFGREGILNKPVDIGIDSHDKVYVTERGNNRISDKGFFRNEGRGSGEFKNPHGIAVDDNGTVYVCDTGNNREQIFEA